MMHAELISAALTSRTNIEQKRLGQDGAFWPFPRHEMRSAYRIRERMAEDIAMNGLRRMFQPETTREALAEDLARLGWLPSQVNTHLAEALATARKDCA